MGSFITGTEIERIHDDSWADWEYVEIREYNQGQRDALDKEIIEMAGAVGEIPKVIMQGALVPVLVAGIHSWTLTMTGEEGGPVAPVTREWMAKLKPSYASFIVRAIRKLNQGRTSAEERDFLRQVGREDLIKDEAASGDNAD